MAGQVLTAGTRAVYPVDIFGDADTDQGVRHLAGMLLADAYPRLPVGPHLMRNSVQPERDAPLLFDGAMLPQPPAEAMETLDAFAPGLGLSTPSAARSLDIAACPASRLIEAELEREGGETDGRVLDWRLARYHGLTYPLAALFILLFLGHTKPAPQVSLRLRHGFQLRDGTQLRSSRLTRGMVQRMAWP